MLLSSLRFTNFYSMFSYFGDIRTIFGIFKNNDSSLTFQRLINQAVLGSSLFLSNQCYRYAFVLSKTVSGSLLSFNLSSLLLASFVKIGLGQLCPDYRNSGGIGFLVRSKDIITQGISNHSFIINIFQNSAVNWGCCLSLRLSSYMFACESCLYSG